MVGLPSKLLNHKMYETFVKHTFSMNMCFTLRTTNQGQKSIAPDRLLSGSSKMWQMKGEHQKCFLIEHQLVAGKPSSE